jgi:hypothetical protein
MHTSFHHDADNYIKGVSVNLLKQPILAKQGITLEAGKIKGVLPFNFVISELGNS